MSDLHYAVTLKCGNCLSTYVANIPKKTKISDAKPPCKNCGCFEYCQVIDPNEGYAGKSETGADMVGPMMGPVLKWPEK